jgi:hypothetical protein
VAGHEIKLHQPALAVAVDGHGVEAAAHLIVGHIVGQDYRV